jgi:hypothetical protein
MLTKDFNVTGDDCTPIANAVHESVREKPQSTKLPRAKAFSETGLPALPILGHANRSYRE